MEKEEEQTKQPMLQVSPAWKLMILGVILITLVGLGMLLFKCTPSSVKKSKRGGVSVNGRRWGAAGGCGCSAPPMP